MHVARPQTALGSTLDTEILIVLARTTRPLTGREISRLVRRGSQSGVNRALRRLEAHGIVEAQQAGRSVLRTLNREHLAAPAVEALAGLRLELLRRLRESLKTWNPPPLHASLFGSAAREDGDTSSDVDVFLVRPRSVRADDRRWRNQIESWVGLVRRWTGNRVSLSEVSQPDLVRLRRRRPAIAASLEADAITLAGPDARKLLGEGEP
jgi:DNA-binding transcriptional ArsR family regulator